jgi:hypothetical protein
MGRRCRMLFCHTVTFVAMSQLRAQARSWQYPATPNLERRAVQYKEFEVVQSLAVVGLIATRNPINLCVR